MILSTAAAISHNTSGIYKNPKLPKGVIAPCQRNYAGQTIPAKRKITPTGVYVNILAGIKSILMEGWPSDCLEALQKETR